MYSDAFRGTVQASVEGWCEPYGSSNTAEFVVKRFGDTLAQGWCHRMPFCYVRYVVPCDGSCNFQDVCSVRTVRGIQCRIPLRFCTHENNKQLQRKRSRKLREHFLIMVPLCYHEGSR